MRKFENLETLLPQVREFTATVEAEVDGRCYKVVKYRGVNVLFEVKDGKESIPNVVPMDLVKQIVGFGKDAYVMDTLVDREIQGVEADSLINESGNVVGYWFPLEVDLVNRVNVIDHHAKTKEMQRSVSTGNLVNALIADNEYQRAQHVELAFVPDGFVPDTAEIIVTHLDADSRLSALMINGQIDKRFFPECERAVICADHTGEEDDLADLLQATEETFNVKESLDLPIAYFAAKKEAEDKGEEFDFEKFLDNYPGVRQLVEVRRQLRKQVEELFDGAKLLEIEDLFPGKKVGRTVVEDKGELSLYYEGEGVFALDGEKYPQTIESEFLPFAVPKIYRSMVKLLVYSIGLPTNGQRRQDAGESVKLYEVKVRAMPDADINIGDIFKRLSYEDQAKLSIKGRWNAGSSRRSGGSTVNGEEAGRMLANAMKNGK